MICTKISYPYGLKGFSRVYLGHNNARMIISIRAGVTKDQLKVLSFKKELPKVTI